MMGLSVEVENWLSKQWTTDDVRSNELGVVKTAWVRSWRRVSSHQCSSAQRSSLKKQTQTPKRANATLDDVARDGIFHDDKSTKKYCPKGRSFGAR
jgi:hypothetical protein